MKRRLYFLLPDKEHTSAVVNEVQAAGISGSNIHTIAGRGSDPGDLPVATRYQRADVAARIERYLWGGNLGIFFVALLVLLMFTTFPISRYWLLLPAGIMLVAFIMGLEFVMHVPNVHLAEFRDALRHQEILLMIDVDVTEVAMVENLVHRTHPEAVVGGVGWSITAMPI